MANKSFDDIETAYREIKREYKREYGDVWRMAYLTAIATCRRTPSSP